MTEVDSEAIAGSSAWDADSRGVRITRVAWDEPRALALRDAMDAEIEPRYADRHSGPGAMPLPAGMRVDPASVIATLIAIAADGTAVGHAAVRRLGDQVEVKRVFVAKGSRGTGLSTRLMLALEDVARDHGAGDLVLQTGDRQPEAVRLYEKLGYHRIPIFPPYETLQYSMCFGKAL